MTYAFNYSTSEGFDFDKDDELLQNLPHFQSGDIINELELVVMDMLEMILGNDRFRYCPQVPLGVICSRPENTSYLPCDLFKFWANSKVDIAVMERVYGASRKAKLVVECQSHWHDRLDAQIRDRKKARLLASVGVPLIYVRRVDQDQRFYRFYTPNGQEEILYNLITQTGRTELQGFLQKFL